MIGSDYMDCCPFISYRNQYTGNVECRDFKCAMWDSSINDCLIRASLRRYVKSSVEIKQKEIEEIK